MRSEFVWLFWIALASIAVRSVWLVGGYVIVRTLVLASDGRLERMLRGPWN